MLSCLCRNSSAIITYIAVKHRTNLFSYTAENCFGQRTTQLLLKRLERTQIHVLHKDKQMSASLKRKGANSPYT